MRHVFTIFRSAAVASLVLLLAAVTAGAAVRGNGNGNGGGNGYGHDKDGKATPPSAVNGGPTTPPGQATAPGQTGTAPGQAGTTPGQSGTAPGQGGTAPGQAGTAPGQAGTASGQAGTTPGQAAMTPAQGTTTTPADPLAAPVPVPPAAPPVIGESMGVQPVAGDVKIRLPHSSGYVPLSAAGSVPSGATVDARGGTIVLRTAVDAAGHTQAARIRGAVFEVRQPKDGKGMTDLILHGGRPQGCPARGSAAMARAAVAPIAKSKPRTSGGLWAQDDHGRFRSRGRNSAATVRGTEWITTETCAGTVTKVVKGAVDVFDRHTKHTVRVRAGHSYLARDAR
jgi:hypothetical protein